MLIDQIELRGANMSRTKEEVIKMIKQMPEEASVSDIMAELHFRQKVDSGLKELDDGK